MSKNAVVSDAFPHLHGLRRKTHFKSEIQEDLLRAKWWARQDLNLRPHAYQACALTNWATGPLFRENGGGYRVRTDDILLAKQMLYQLS